MKIIFTKVRYKNFFSTGNSFIEINLVSNDKVCLYGENGAGKSTMFSAISFGLFGKTIKDVNKPKIVNSINKKDCLVEIEFYKGSDEYLVRRGVKPNIFEIYENGVLLDQTAINDYQTHLETKILKSTYRTFIQTSIISIENYKPFMSLSAKERREFVEDILDINIFSIMNTLLKSRISKSKDDLKFIDIELKNAKSSVLVMKDHLDELIKNRDKMLTIYDDKNKEFLEEIDAHNNKANTLLEEVEKIQLELESFPSNKVLDSSSLSKLINTIESSITRIEKDEKFFTTNEGCPSCLQDISHTHKKSIQEKLDFEKDKLKADLLENSKNLEKIREIQDDKSHLQTQISDIQYSIKKEQESISQLQRFSKKNQDEKNQFLEDCASIDTKKAELKRTASEAIKVQNKKAALNEERSYLDSAYDMLKDSGIKARIIKQYTPLINKYLNEYLELFDFFVSFNLDEEFNETIKSRHRDHFSYDNFSAGEKQRIDLSSLFSMRKIAKIKNSFDCNLLMFDEILDSSLDSTGTELFLNLLDSKEFSTSNIFIISHKNKDKLAERFGSSIEFRKENSFTVIEQHSF